MELLKTEDVATVTIFQVRISEGEFQIFADALAYLLTTLDDENLNKVFFDEKQRALTSASETKEFVEETYSETMNMIVEHCREEFLAQRFRIWKKKE